MLALDAVDEQVGHFGVGVHEIPQHHSLLGVLGAPGDNEGVAVGAAGVLDVVFVQLHEDDFLAGGLVVLVLLAGLPVLNHSEAVASQQVVLGAGGDVRHDQAFLVPLIHPLAVLAVAVGGMQADDLSAVRLDDVLQNTQAVVQGVDRQGLLIAAAGPSGNHRIHIGMSLVDLHQNLVHVIPSAHFGNRDAQLVHDVLTHGEAAVAGGVLLVRQRVQHTAEVVGLQVGGVDHFQSALAPNLHQVIQGGSPGIAHAGGQLAGQVVVVEQVDHFAGGQGQVDLVVVLAADQLHLNANQIAGDVADSSGNLVAVLGFSGTSVPNHQFGHFAGIGAANGLIVTHVNRIALGSIAALGRAGSTAIFCGAGVVPAAAASSHADGQQAGHQNGSSPSPQFSHFYLDSFHPSKVFHGSYKYYNVCLGNVSINFPFSAVENPTTFTFCSKMNVENPTFVC